MRAFTLKTQESGAQATVYYEIRESDGTTVVESDSCTVSDNIELKQFLQKRAAPFDKKKVDPITIGEIDITPITPSQPTPEELTARAFRKDLSLLILLNSAVSAGVDVKSDATDLAADLSVRYVKGILG